MSDIITVVVHGTFAAEAKWWQLGSEDQPTFADRLESELSCRGLSGTVWKPALEKGFEYSSFAWSGRNRHSDRVKGAKQLSSSLNELAERRAATSNDPLTVNVVAHSHGGNVVLEALRGLNQNVQVGRVALLGTPLITTKPVFRIARFIFSVVVLFFLLLAILMVMIQFGSFVSTGHLFDTAAQNGREAVKGSYLLKILPGFILYGWIFWLLGNLLDVIWRVVCRLFEPLAWLRGRSRALVYGPSPHVLSKTLGGHPILLLTSYNDEADLLLQVGSAPARLYREYVATEFSKLGRVLEFIFLRPFVLGMLLKASEMMLEVFSLGFSFWRSLVLDVDVAPLHERPYYPPHLLVQQKIDLHPDTISAVKARVSEPRPTENLECSPTQRRAGLCISLQEVTHEIKEQIQLRHSAYYENPAVIHRIAEFLTGAEVKGEEEAKPALSLKPSSNFWEALLVGNVALVVLFAWITRGALAEFATLQYFAIWLASYAFPLATLGLITGLYWIFRHHMPSRLWRWFWTDWAVWAGMVMILALGTVLDASK